MRRPDGEIHTESHPVQGLLDRKPWLRRSVLRGPLALSEAISVGLRGLRVAVRVGSGTEVGQGQLGASLGIVTGSLLAFFVIGPGVAVAMSTLDGVIADVVEGAGRLVMFVLYLLLVARSASAKRLFSYHGAEHMTIAAFERSGVMPRADDVREFSPVHSRCGTNFLTLFMITCGVVFAFFPRDPLLLGAAWRVLLLPVVAALAYEVMRTAARSGDAIWSRVIVAPGRAMQRITTRQPTDDQIQVALSSLHALLDD